MEERLNGTRK